jgi:hypothetical protein
MTERRTKIWIVFLPTPTQWLVAQVTARNKIELNASVEKKQAEGTVTTAENPGLLTPLFSKSTYLVVSRQHNLAVITVSK